MRRWQEIKVAMIALGAAAMTLAAPAAAQVRSVDPNSVIDADLDHPQPATPPATTPAPATPSAPTAPATPAPGAWTTEGLANDSTTTGGASSSGTPSGGTTADATGSAATGATPAATPANAPGTTFQRDDLIGAAEGVFGRGAEGLARLIENILRDQGEPTAYIVGREASGAFVLGLRYGSGTLHHRVEGTMPAYWTGPSIGFDAGANGGSTFVLVYNLHASDDLFHRFPAGEGAAYLVGGFNASYLRRGDIVLIPIRMGVGARLGINVGYMKFSHRQNWLPF